MSSQGAGCNNFPGKRDSNYFRWWLNRIRSEWLVKCVDVHERILSIINYTASGEYFSNRLDKDIR